MKKNWVTIMILSILIILTACENNVNAPDIDPTPTTEQYQHDVLSYEQYVNIVSSIHDELRFSSATMKLTESSLEKSRIIIVDEDVSFGKKTYLSLNNELKDTTQHFLTYQDTEKGYKLITGWIYTNVNQGNNLLYFKPNIEGNTGDFNSILSYKNILVHIQLTHTTSSPPSDEEFVKENEAVLKDIVSFLQESDAF